jgi:Holliday junction DNA helicase RuvA
VIGRLTGHVVGQGDDGVVTLDVGGVGYEVSAPLGSLGRARRDPDGRTTLHVHTVVREDALLLYGFATLEEREVFRTVISISGVGPKTGLAILAALPPADLAAAIARKELSRLTSISGVGKKTAERLLLELKDKLTVAPSLESARPIPSPLTTKGELLRSALVNMGFRPAEVDRGVDAVKDRLAHAELTDLVRDALSAVSR